MPQAGQDCKLSSPLLAAAGALRYAAGYAAGTGHPSLGCSLGFASTHLFINHQALAILRHDGRKDAVRLLIRYQRFLDAGNCSADSRLGSTSHYFNPHTNRGLWCCTPSTRACTRYFLAAVRAWLDDRPRRAVFYLGLASHLVQDACVPHHAHGLTGRGHSQYEKWAQRGRERYAVTSGGLYRPVCVTPAEWVVFNSRIAYDYLWLVTKPENTVGFHQATTDLLALAQRSTAGFWIYFLEKVGAPH